MAGWVIVGPIEIQPPISLERDKLFVTVLTLAGLVFLKVYYSSIQFQIQQA